MTSSAPRSRLLFWTGLATMLPGLQFVFPVATPGAPGIEVGDAAGMFYARHWGLMAVCVGALLVGASRPVGGRRVGTSSDTFYQFHARRSSEQDVVDKDPNRIVSSLQEQYHRSEHLDIGNTQDVETVMLVRYEPGVELFVRDVQFERDHARLVLHKDRKGDLATTLTVKWPVPLTADLTESALIDSVLSRFITRK